MPKKRNKVARYQVSINEPQKNMLDEMMEEDAQTEVSSFFGIILVNEYKRRQVEKNKRPQGRPRKEDNEDEEEEDPYINDLPKDINWFNEKIGPKEYADKLELQKQFKPRG